MSSTPGALAVRHPLPGVWVVRFSGPRPLMRAVPEHYGSTMHLAGRSEWTSGGERWSSSPGSISLKVPGEVAVEHAREGTPAFQVALFETSLIEEAQAALGRPRVRSWHHAIDSRDPRAKPLATLHRHLLDEAPASALEQATCEAVHALLDTMGTPSGTTRVRCSPHVSRARALLDERFTETIDLDALAAHAQLDKFRLCRAFREQVGMPPHAYVTHRRIARAQALLARGMPQAEVAASVGFYDQSLLHRHFKRILRMTPGRVRPRRRRALATWRTSSLESEREPRASIRSRSRSRERARYRARPTRACEDTVLASGYYLGDVDPAPTGDEMPSATTDERRRSFDQMAALYARARGAPPPALFDAVAAFVPPPADALEIGCGPGNASLPLLERGFRIHAVELGENLAAFARERLAAFPFTVEVCKFEEASLEAASVDLVVCSSAFHWLDRERALRQVVKVLQPGGALALIWGSPRRTAEDNRVDEATQAAYRVHAPEISRQAVDRMGGKVDEIGQAVRDTPELCDFEEQLFPQTHLFDRQSYVDTLATFSDHATMPAEQRARLFDAIGEIIDGQFDGRVERHSTARLQLARRR